MSVLSGVEMHGWLVAGLYAVAGFVAGALFFSSLARNLRGLVDGGPVWQLAGGVVWRFGVTGTVLVLAARTGAAALLAAFAGWMLARAWRLRVELR